MYLHVCMCVYAYVCGTTNTCALSLPFRIARRYIHMCMQTHVYVGITTCVCTVATCVCTVLRTGHTHVYVSRLTIHTVHTHVYVSRLTIHTVHTHVYVSRLPFRTCVCDVARRYMHMYIDMCVYECMCVYSYICGTLNTWALSLSSGIARLDMYIYMSV